MFKHKKIIVFTVLLLTLILSVGAISAADDDSTSQIDNNDVQVTAESITNDDLVSTTQDNTVQSSPKSIKTDSNNTININKDNYQEQGWVREDDDNGKFAISYYGESSSNDVTFVFEDSIDDNLNSIIISDGNNITISASPDVTFHNVAFAISEASNTTLKNMKINIDDDYVYSLIGYSNIIYIMEDSTGTIIDNVTVDYYLPEGVDVEYPASVLDIRSDVEISNSEFIINTFTSTVEWDPISGSQYGTNDIMPIRAQNLNGNTYVNFINNNIYINATNESGGFPTLYAMTIGCPNSIIANNTIEIHGTGWLYAITSKGDYNQLINNHIYVTGTNYTGGIFIQDASYSLVDNNTIILEASAEKDEGAMTEPVTYGIVLENYAYKGATYHEGTGNVKNNTISNNNITCTANNMYAVEQFGGDNTSVVNNIMVSTGETAMGIGIIGANSVITGNDITVSGLYENGVTVDYLTAKTTGIYTGRGSNAQISGNTIQSTFSGIYNEYENSDIIEENTVTCDGEYTVKLVATNETVVTNNYLEATELVGDESVYSNTQTNTVSDNMPEPTLAETEIVITSDVAKQVEFNDLIDIEGYFTVDGQQANFDVIEIYDNDKLIEAIESWDSEGAIFYTYDATALGKHTLRFVFKGNETHNPTETNVSFNVYNPDAAESYIDFVMDSTVDSGETLDIDAILHATDDDETPIADAAVLIKVIMNDEVISEIQTTSDEEGGISYAFDTTGLSGTATIQLIFEGNEDYLASSSSEEVEIIAPEKKDVIIMIVVNDEYVIDDIITVEGSIFTLDNDEAVTDVDVNVKATYSDGSSNAVIVTTNSEGSFMAELPASVLGEATITVSITDNALYNDNTESETIEIIQKPAQPTLLVLDADSPLYSGESIDVAAQLVSYDENQQETAIANVDVDVKISINDEVVSQETVTTDETGRLSYSFDTTGYEGTAVVEATFAGNDAYLESTSSTEVEILPAKKDVVILLEVDDEYTEGDQIEITGLITLEDDTPVVDQIVNVTITFADGTSLTVESSPSDEEGYFMTSLPTNVVGEATITVTLEENDQYNHAEETVTTQILEKEPYVTLTTINTDDEVESGEELTIDGIIIYNNEDEDEFTLADTPITIKITINNETILETSVTTDSEGMFSYTFDTTGYVGEATIEAIYEGNDDYLASSDNSVVNIIKVKKEVTIEANIDDTYHVGEEIVLDGTLTTATDETPIANKEVTVVVTFADASTRTFTLTTAEDGTFTTTFTADAAGVADITITAEEDEDYLEATTQLSTTISKMSTTTTINVLNDTLGNVTIEVSVADENDEPVEGTVVVSDAEGNILTTASLAEGKANIVIQAEEAGALTVVVSFDESDVYLASQDTVEIDVKIIIQESQITLDDITAYVNNQATITATVTDTDGNNINGGVVVFTDGEGNILGQANVEDGVASIDVLYTEVLTTEVTATYTSGSEFITDSEATATLTVKNAMTIIEIDEVELKAGQTVNLTARVHDEAGNNITVGKVVFKVNGKTIKDANGKVIYAKVVNGIATVEYTVPEEFGGQDINILASYSGNSKIPGAKTDINVSVGTKDATLTLTSPEEAQVGSIVTLTATVNDTKAVNSGKIVFKINGKTLKDENGKVIYAKITNNVASIEYVIPESMKAKTYNLTAVFLSDEYERLEATNEITIN